MHYGWSPVQAPSRVVAHSVFNPGMWKCYGAVLATLAAAAISLTIVDVVLTIRAYCTPWSEENYCSLIDEPYVWTWVASGTWGSIPMFIAGLFAICLSANPAGWTRCFSAFVFLSALAFAPGVLVLTCIEGWRSGCSDYGSFYYFNKNGSALLPGSIMPDGPYKAKFAIPFAIASLAGIMFVMTAAVTWILCCRPSSIGLSTRHHVSTKVVTVPAMISQPAPVIQQQIPVESVYYTTPQVQNQCVSPYGSATVYNDITPKISMPTRFNSGVMYGNFASPVFFKPTVWKVA